MPKERDDHPICETDKAWVIVGGVEFFWLGPVFGRVRMLVKGSQRLGETSICIHKKNMLFLGSFPFAFFYSYI